MVFDRLRRPVAAPLVGRGPRGLVTFPGADLFRPADLGAVGAVRIAGRRAARVRQYVGALMTVCGIASLAWAGLSKAMDPYPFALGMLRERVGLPFEQAVRVAQSLGSLECALCVGVLWAASRRVAAIAMLGVGAAFATIVAYDLATGHQGDCGCFGADSPMNSRTARGVIAGLILWAAWRSRGSSAAREGSLGRGGGVEMPG